MIFLQQKQSASICHTEEGPRKSWANFENRIWRNHSLIYSSFNTDHA